MFGLAEENNVGLERICKKHPFSWFWLFFLGSVWSGATSNSGMYERGENSGYQSSFLNYSGLDAGS